MKRISLIAAAALIAALPAKAQEVQYALPRTVVTLEVSTASEVFHAGKYARYSRELLGIDVPLKDTVLTEITKVRIVPKVEADPAARHAVLLTDNTRPEFLELTAQGLVAGNEAGFKAAGGLRFKGPVKSGSGSWKAEASKARKAEKPRTPVYEQQVVTHTDSLGREVSELVMVEVEPVDSLYLEACDYAETLRDLREMRYKILIGDTDATYSGEALGAALKEFDKLESELLPLFQGTSETFEQNSSYDFIPTAEGTFPVFTLENGTAFSIEVEAEPLAKVKPLQVGKKQASHNIVYRIPATCTISLTDGRKTVTSVRVPVYQLGIEATYPIYD